MNNAWILYNEHEYKKNQFFIETFIETMAERGVELSLFLNGNCKNMGINEIKKNEKPLFVINRTRDYRLSRFFETNGIMVFNNSIVSEIANDKWNSYLFAMDLKIPVLETNLLNQVQKEKITYPQIVKKRIGHGGNDVFFIETLEQLNSWAENRDESQYIIQKAVQTGKDVRAYVLGKRVVVSFLRENNNDFRANYSLGGTAKTTTLSKDQKNIIKKIMTGLNLGLVGVDFVFDSGVPFFNELEDVVGTRMIYEKTNINIIKEYANLIMSKVGESR